MYSGLEHKLRKGLHSKRFVKDLILLDSTDSTNNHGLSLKEKKEGMVILARKQIGGRGRDGRLWHSVEDKSIAMSIIIDYPKSNDSITFVPLLSANAIVDTLDFFGLNSKIKWPNDVLINSKKVSGVLCESSFIKNYSNFIISFLPKYLNDKSMIDDMNVYQNLKMFQNDNPKKLKQKNIRRKKSNNIINCWDRDTLNSQLYFSYMIGAIKRELMSKPTFKFKFDKYIDIGCGDCTLAIELGKLLEIPNKNIYGIDLPKWSQYDEKKRKNLPINIKTFNKGDKLPYKNKMFSFVTAIMVLHHVENLDLMMKEINRIMPIGGYFLFREHDAITYADYMLCDIEHMLYNIIKHNKDEKAFNDFYAKYYDKYEWQMILHKYGFAFIVGDYIYTDIKEKIRPTRAMYRVWKKVKEYDSDT